MWGSSKIFSQIYFYILAQVFDVFFSPKAGTPRWNSRGQNPEKEIENACKTVVDVRDVARAHVEAIARDLGGERILLIGGSPHFEDRGWEMKRSLGC